MIILRINAADEPVRPCEHVNHNIVLFTVRSVLFDDLPCDVRSCEVTVVALFRASLLLNFLTGGDPAMTFSARAWRARRVSKGRLLRTVWIATSTIIDVVCAILRGERAHCETAWNNYVKRPPA